MILKVYSILDKKLNEFLPPMFCKDDSDALRTCSQLVNFSDSLMNRFPDDYCLHYICDFDSKEGLFSDSVGESASVICELVDLVKDDTKKYVDVLKRIETNSNVLDSKLSLFDNKLQQVDSLIARAENKVAKLESKNVDVPDFLPTNSKTKVTSDDVHKFNFLKRLFS